VLNKLGVENRTQAAVIAVRYQLERDLDMTV
jgi:DNA-binding NarL/FixJ family response regulator